MNNNCVACAFAFALCTYWASDYSVTKQVKAFELRIEWNKTNKRSEINSDEKKKQFGHCELHPKCTSLLRRAICIFSLNSKKYEKNTIFDWNEVISQRSAAFKMQRHFGWFANWIENKKYDNLFWVEEISFNKQHLGSVFSSNQTVHLVLGIVYFWMEVCYLFRWMNVLRFSSQNLLGNSSRCFCPLRKSVNIFSVFQLN